MTQRWMVWAVLAAAATLALSACGRSTSSLTIESSENNASMAPDFITAVYTPADINTADIYISDIAADVLADPSVETSTLSGSLIHMHLFIVPEAGKTPIDPKACTATIRHVVLAEGRIGVYGGGGFLYPDTKPGNPTFYGALMDATLQLQRETPGFNDRLGKVHMKGAVGSMRDDTTSRAIAQRLELIVASLRPVAQTTDVGKTKPTPPPAAGSKK